uniref:Single-stranded DNA binding protein Ssb-like OB fold domain-containing protein n=1 Tax=Oryza punctata TaxID=4537 RepID=A0A0E0KXD6_ORYPU
MKGFVFSVIKSPLRFAFFSARNPLVAAVVLLGSSSPLPRVHPFIQLRPGTHGHNLLLKVVDSKMVLQRGGGPQGRHMRIAECLVGDETGIIVFTARNDQVDVMKPGASVDLRNAKIDMFKGSMRLAVDKWGIVKAAESPADFTVKEDNNMSLIEFELVTVVE